MFVQTAKLSIQCKENYAVAWRYELYFSSVKSNIKLTQLASTRSQNIAFTTRNNIHFLARSCNKYPLYNSVWSIIVFCDRSEIRYSASTSECIHSTSFRFVLSCQYSVAVKLVSLADMNIAVPPMKTEVRQKHHVNDTNMIFKLCLVLSLHALKFWTHFIHSFPTDRGLWERDCQVL